MFMTLIRSSRNKNVGALVQRIHDLQISTVFLQAFADPDASGIARQVYFPNSQLPVRADLFNRVAWQIKTRTGFKSLRMVAGACL